MSIVGLLEEIASATSVHSGYHVSQTYEPPTEFADDPHSMSPHTAGAASPTFSAVSSGRHTLAEGLGVAGLATESLLSQDTLGRLDSIISTSTAEGLSRATGALPWAPGALQCFQGVNDVIRGIHTHDSHFIAAGIERVLRACGDITAGALRVAVVAGPAEYIAPGIGILGNVIDLVNGVQHLVRTRGRRVATQVLFALLVQEMPETSTSLFQTSAALKLNFYNLSSNMASMYWVAYKYNPSWLVEMRTCIQRIGLPTLGIASAILGILLLALATATMGTTALILGVVAASATLGLTLFRSIKYFQSRAAFQTHIAPYLYPQGLVEIKYCLGGTHKLLGPSTGDFYRYNIAVLLFTHFINNRLIVFPSDVSTLRQSIDRIYIDNPLDSFGGLIHDLLVDAVWEIISHDLGVPQCQRLLATAHELMGPTIADRDPDTWHKSRLKTIKLFFRALRVNR